MSSGSQDTVMTWSERSEWNGKEPVLLVTVTGYSVERPGQYNGLLVQRLCGDSHVDIHKFQDGASLIVTLDEKPIRSTLPALYAVHPNRCEVIQ